MHKQNKLASLVVGSRGNIRTFMKGSVILCWFFFLLPVSQSLGVTVYSACSWINELWVSEWSWGDGQCIVTNSVIWGQCTKQDHFGEGILIQGGCSRCIVKYWCVAGRKLIGQLFCTLSICDAMKKVVLSVHVSSLPHKGLWIATIICCVSCLVLWLLLVTKHLCY